MAWASPLERFGSYYSVAENGCWIWQKFKDKDGYGFIRVNGVRQRAHRYSYLIFVGDIPDGMVVCHKCDNPSCVNPNHLFVGTKKDNTQDMFAKGRNGKFDRLKGSKHPNTSLNETDVLSIFHSSKSYSALSKQYGVGKSSIARIKHGKTWAHITQDTQNVV